MTLASMSESMRNAFYRDQLERVAVAPLRVPFARAIPSAPAHHPGAGRICLSCGARESGGALPCGH